MFLCLSEYYPTSFLMLHQLQTQTACLLWQLPFSLAAPNNWDLMSGPSFGYSLHQSLQSHETI